MIFDEIFSARNLVCLCLIARGLVFMKGKRLHHRSRESRIMNRSKLRNNFLKTRNEESRRCFNRQRNFCVILLRKTKRRIFGKLDHKVVSGNRKFWKTVGLLVSNNAFHKESIILNNTKLLVIMRN